MDERTAKSAQPNDAFRSSPQAAFTAKDTAPYFSTDSFGGVTIHRKATCACGGGCPACQATFNDLKVSEPHDAAEIEADQIADRVMRMGADALVKVNHHSSDPKKLQAKCSACEEEEEREETSIQRKEGSIAADPISPGDGAPPSNGLSSVRNVINPGGSPLDRETRSFFEPRFGVDLSHVRIHTDSAAGQSARAVNARAYTLGNNIVFGTEAYAANKKRDGHLLAHELAHVVQQTTGQTRAGTIQRQAEASGTAEPDVAPHFAPYRLEFNNSLIDPRGHASLYELGPALLGFGLEKLSERHPGLNRSFWYRLGEWVLLGVVPMVPYMVFSHELGHYSIGKQFGWSPVPRMTGWMSGVTSRGAPPGTTVTTQQSIAFAAGGVNQEEINARVIYARWALRGNVRYQEAMAYLLAQTNLALYAARTLSLSNPASSDDINNYVTQTGSLSTGQLLAVAALADLLSGPAWAALIGQYQFLSSGQRRVAIPTFTLGEQTLTYPHFQMQLLSGGPILGGRMFLNPSGRLPVEFTFDTQLTSPGVALGAKLHDIPLLTPRLRLSPFLRATFDDPMGIALGVDIDYKIAPWLGISGTLGIRQNDLLAEPALPSGILELGGAATLTF